MNSREIHEHMKKDIDTDRFENFLKAKMSEFKKVRKNVRNGQKCARAYTFLSYKTMQEYIVILTSDGFPKDFFTVAKINRGEKPHLYVTVAENEEGYNAACYSPHFFNRYCERENLQGATTMGQKICAYCLQDYPTVKIWEEDNGEAIRRVVYANGDGLELGTHNNEIGVTFFNTYVPKNMLKTSQVEAFEKATQGEYSIINKNKVYRTHADYSNEIRSILISGYSKTLSEASDIYNQFYEKEE